MNKPIQMLEEGLKHWGYTMDEKKSHQFIMYLDLLLDWNERMNLTSITALEDVIVYHFLDSLSVLSWKKLLPGAKVMDMGTGAGFPGIPLKIMIPEIELVLVDSVHKKTLFLKEVVDTLSLDGVEILHARGEELGQHSMRREAYDLVVSRAVAELRTLVEYCLPFVKVAGYFAAYKGPGGLEEAKNAEQAVKTLGGGPSQIFLCDIPYSLKTHNIIFIPKQGKTPKKYPRAGGKPRTTPL